MVWLQAGTGAISSELSPVGAPAQSQVLQLEIRLKLRNRDQLNQLLQEQQDPASAAFHRWLTPTQFSSKFGPSAVDLASVTRWLASGGFTINSVDPQMGIIEFTGTIADAARVFATSFHQFTGNHYAPTSDPMIPARFEGVIGSIHGLDNLLHHHFNRLAAPEGKVRGTRTRVTPRAGLLVEPRLPLDPNLMPAVLSQPQFAGAAGLAFGPLDLQTFYNSTPLLESGDSGTLVDCIAFAEDSDFLTSAVDLFSSTFGLPTPAITRVLPDGSNPGIAADEIEALLDLEWAHAAAPGAPLAAYLGSGANALQDALTRIVRDNACGTIEISFGFCGGPNTFYSVTLDSLFSQAAAQGQSILVSSGDAGAAGLVPSANLNQCVTGTSRHVSEVAASTNVTAVGGTQFTPNYAANGNDIGNVPESVWDDLSTGASGGGASMIFPKPVYQNAPGVPADGVRDLPDISFGASPSNSPGFYFADDNNGVPVVDCCVGGTSLSATVMAGFSKLLAQRSGGRLGNINPRLYQLGPLGSTAGFRSVTSGTNSFNGVTGFNARAGYNQATGWGSLDIATLVTSYTAAAALTASPEVIASAFAGQTVGAGGFRVDNTGPSPIAIASVTITASDSALFASLSLAASGVSNQTVSATPASSTTFQFSPPITLATGASESFALSATVSMSPAALFNGRPAYAALPLLPSSPMTRLGFALLPVGILLMPVGRRTQLKIALAVAGLLAIAAASSGCGGGGGGGGLPSASPSFSSTQSVPAGGVSAGGATLSGLPADLSKITAP